MKDRGNFIALVVVLVVVCVLVGAVLARVAQLRDHGKPMDELSQNLAEMREGRAFVVECQDLYVREYPGWARHRYTPGEEKGRMVHPEYMTTVARFAKTDSIAIARESCEPNQRVLIEVRPKP